MMNQDTRSGDLDETDLLAKDDHGLLDARIEEMSLRMDLSQLQARHDIIKTCNDLKIKPLAEHFLTQ